MTGDLGHGDYIVIVDGERRRYAHWDEIPEVVDQIIRFVPEIPPEPHTPEQHEAIERLPTIMDSFMARERGAHARNDADR